MSSRSTHVFDRFDDEQESTGSLLARVKLESATRASFSTFGQVCQCRTSSLCCRHMTQRFVSKANRHRMSFGVML